MAVGLDDIIQITDFQTFLGQQILNVYFYRVMAIPDSGTWPNPYDAFLGAFDSIVMDPVRNNQHTSLVHTVAVLKNLTNGVDIREYATGQAGLQGGDEEPSFTALGVRLVRSTALTRHGSKRFGGMPESAFTGNTINLAPTAIADFEDACKSNLIIPGTAVDGAEPVIVGRTLIPASDPPEYELDLLKINVVADAQVIAVTTQNTRKAGRGS